MISSLTYPVSLLSGWSSKKSKFQYRYHLLGNPPDDGVGRPVAIQSPIFFQDSHHLGMIIPVTQWYDYRYIEKKWWLIDVYWEKWPIYELKLTNDSRVLRKITVRIIFDYSSRKKLYKYFIFASKWVLTFLPSWGQCCLAHSCGWCWPRTWSKSIHLYGRKITLVLHTSNVETSHHL